MKIALLSPFEEPVPPLKYGGTELVVANLANGLVARGHEVHLLASGDSHTKAHLVPLFPQALRALPDMDDAKLREAFKYIGVGRMVAYLQKEKFDVVHNHVGWRVLASESIIKDALVTTLHGPLDTLYLRRFYEEFAKSAYTSISLSQRKPMPELNYVANVYNGIEVDKFDYQETPADYLAFLGRMSPEKGPLQAIAIAKAAKKKLIMAAKVDTVDKQFYEEKVKPEIDGEQIQFIGEVDHPGKVKLLGGAQALLAAIQWEEPFGLFMVEALACGTPVIAFHRGSVPELIDDGQTGFIVETVDQATEAVDKIKTISRAHCRAVAEQRFSVGQMVASYEAVYQRL